MNKKLKTNNISMAKKIFGSCQDIPNLSFAPKIRLFDVLCRNEFMSNNQNQRIKRIKKNQKNQKNQNNQNNQKSE